MIKVIIADDHPLIRAGLKYLLSGKMDIQLAAEVDNGNDLIKELSKESFDVVLLDMIMPGRHGLDIVKKIRKDYPKLQIIVLSVHKEDMFALRALKAGAAGYVCKDYAAENLVNAIHMVANGNCFISPIVAQMMAKELHAPNRDALPHTLLSDREYQVFLLIAAGVSVSNIAERLNLSVKTVSTHKARIKEKMKFTNSSDYVRYALTNNLL